MAYALVMAAAALFCSGAWAQTAVKIVMPAPAGGAGDIVARMLTEQVGRAQGLTLVIENRPGAGTIIGTEAVARAAPDGTTLLITAPYLVIAPHLRKLNFDPLTGFEPICHLVSSPGVIVVNSSSPYRTLGDFLDAARAKPGELTFAAVGPGTVQHVGFEMLKRAANVNLTFVPYTGGAPAITALLGGHVTAVFAEYAPLAEHIKAGRLRAVAATTGKRIDSLPELPTVGETYNDYEVDFWWGCSHPPRRRRKQRRNTPAGSPRRCARPRSRPSSTRRGSFRSDRAARISPRFCASNMTITAASFARQISRRNNPSHLLAMSAHGTKRTCRDGLIIVRFQGEADVRGYVASPGWVAIDPELT
jgi:tripartite-type tricarboxylate transporter receptor subunit TctC